MLYITWFAKDQIKSLILYTTATIVMDRVESALGPVRPFLSSAIKFLKVFLLY
jgi:hypothetical protein